MKPPSARAIAEAMKAFDELDAAPEKLQPCSLAFYRQVVRQLPRPTGEQIDNFVQFIATAHSWYKHLPLLLPGAPFVFCLDPMVGYDRALKADGRPIHRERTETSMIADRRWPTTQAYREQYGCLAYFSPAGGSVAGRVGDDVFTVEIPFGFTTADAAYELPAEVKVAGLVELTAVIQPSLALMLAAHSWGRLQRLRDGTGNPPDRWPEETGGSETLCRLIEIGNRRAAVLKAVVDAKKSAPASMAAQADDELSRVFVTSQNEAEQKLEELFLPERQRLQRQMVAAIERMLDLVDKRSLPDRSSV